MGSRHDLEPLAIITGWQAEAEKLGATRLRREIVDLSDKTVSMLGHVTELNYWSVRIDAGWVPLTTRLHEQLRRYCEGYRIYQIKEKFGGLRYYVDLLDFPEDVRHVVKRIITDYETRSLKICDRCGAPGSLITEGYYYRTRCKDHAV